MPREITPSLAGTCCKLVSIRAGLRLDLGTFPAFHAHIHRGIVPFSIHLHPQFAVAGPRTSPNCALLARKFLVQFTGYLNLNVSKIRCSVVGKVKETDPNCVLFARKFLVRVTRLSEFKSVELLVPRGDGATVGFPCQSGRSYAQSSTWRTFQATQR